MQAAEKLALREPPPLRASPTKTPSGLTSAPSSGGGVSPTGPLRVGRTRAEPSAVRGAVATTVAARVEFVSRRSRATCGSFSRLLTEVRLSQPALVTDATVATTAVIPHPRRRRRITFQFMRRIVGVTALAANGAGFRPRQPPPNRS